MNRCTDCGFHDLSKEERTKLVRTTDHVIQQDVRSENSENIRRYASDCDTHTRKNTHLIIGQRYHDNHNMRTKILSAPEKLSRDHDEKVRQTVVRALGETGRTNADNIREMLEITLDDTHHPDPNTRQETVHRIEQRERTHPNETLPFLKEVQNNSDRKMRKTVMHALGPISCKKRCLEEVVSDLKEWEDGDLVDATLKEIVDVHRRYEQFSTRTQKEAIEYVEQ